MSLKLVLEMVPIAAKVVIFYIKLLYIQIHTILEWKAKN